MITPARFVLLDRDGTLNVERGYLSDPDQLELIPGAAEGLRRFRSLGLGLIVITNQSGIGRGFFDLSRLEQIHIRLRDLLHAEGVELDGIYACPHRPEDRCGCRKPRPGLVEQAARDFPFIPSECVVIGDKPTDIALGKQIAAATLLVRTGYGAATAAGWSTGPADEADDHADCVVADLVEAAEAVRRMLGVV